MHTVEDVYNLVNSGVQFLIIYIALMSLIVALFCFTKIGE